MKNLSYEAWVTSFIEALSDYFNLAGWRIRIEFSDEDHGESYAETSVNSAYQTSTVHVYAPAKRDFETGNFDYLIMALTHELVHIFVDPFHAWAEPHLSEVTAPDFMRVIEQQTQKITMIFLKTLPPDIIPPRTKNGKHHPTPKNNPA